MSYEQYGLTPVDASGSDHNKGIVGDGTGKFYQIEGFKHGQKDGLDKDKGGTFSTNLKADAAKAGFTPSNFNTAGDVENAITALSGGEQASASASTPEEPYTPSEEITEAKERVKAWNTGKFDNDIYGTGEGAAVRDVDLGEKDPYKVKGTRDPVK